MGKKSAFSLDPSVGVLHADRPAGYSCHAGDRHAGYCCHAGALVFIRAGNSLIGFLSESLVFCPKMSE